jgi:hypothetical protein
MPTTQVQFRRGNNAQNLAFTGALGEVTVDTTNNILRVHDGVTAGGFETVSTTGTQTLENKTLNNCTINSPTITGNISGGANLIYGTSLISISGNITAGNITTLGISTSVSYSASGNVTGGNIITAGVVSASGNITGANVNITGNIFDTGALTINSGANGNITITPNGTGTTIVSSALSAAGNVSGGNLNITGNIVDTGTLFVISGANGNISLTPNGTGVVTVSSAANVTGNIASANFVFDSKGELRSIPINSQTTSYSLVITDAGKFISSNANVTVPASVFNTGDSVSVYNNSAASITIVQGAGVTMYNVGTASTGNRTLAQRGLATVLCVSANTFVATGGGLT